jgi:uncharacterized protein YdeI (YjbR/CyaY-like superfamily)
MPTKPKSFKLQDDFRAWLEKHHDSEKELMMRLYKVHARDKGIGYREALDEALCFGWIDGVRKALDDDSFVQRFTPRRARSYWSAVNIKRANELVAEGRMHSAGHAAFKERDKSAKARYSFENRPQSLDAALEKQFRANTTAWAYWESCPPYYKRVVSFYVMGAKRDETRQRRLANVIRHSAKRERLPGLTPNK